MFAGKLFQSFIAEYTKLLLLHFDLLGIIKFLLVALLVLPWLKVKFWLRYVGARPFAILKTWFSLSWDTLSGTFNILTLSKISCVMEVLGSMFNTRVVRRQRSSPRGNQIKIPTFSECHSKFKVKFIRSEIMVWSERSCHKEYTCEIWKTYLFTVHNLWPRLKFLKSRSNFKVKVTR